MSHVEGHTDDRIAEIAISEDKRKYIGKTIEYFDLRFVQHVGELSHMTLDCSVGLDHYPDNPSPNAKAERVKDEVAFYLYEPSTTTLLTMNKSDLSVIADIAEGEIKGNYTLFFADDNDMHAEWLKDRRVIASFVLQEKLVVDQPGYCSSVSNSSLTMRLHFVDSYEIDRWYSMSLSQLRRILNVKNN
jgi:hypothetical protein